MSIEDNSKDAREYFIYILDKDDKITLDDKAFFIKLANSFTSRKSNTVYYHISMLLKIYIHRDYEHPKWIIYGLLCGKKRKITGQALMMIKHFNMYDEIVEMLLPSYIKYKKRTQDINYDYEYYDNIRLSIIIKQLAITDKLKCLVIAEMFKAGIKNDNEVKICIGTNPELFV